MKTKGKPHRGKEMFWFHIALKLKLNSSDGRSITEFRRASQLLQAQQGGAMGMSNPKTVTGEHILKITFLLY